MAKKKTTRSRTSAAKSTKSPTKKKSTKKKAAKKVTKKKVTKKSTKKKSTKKAPTKKKVTKKTAKKSKKKSTKKAPTKSKKKTTKKTTKKKVSKKPAAKAPAAKTPEEQLAEAMEKEWTIPQLKRVKTGLSRKELNEYLQLLLEKRSEIIGNVQGMEDARNAALGDIAHMPLHMADVGSDNFEQEFTLGLMESERSLLREIEEAILRMREGYYGVCLESGRPIDKMRLEFAPWAKYCIEVARLREKRGW